MAIRPILTVPDPVLKQVSKPVAAVTDETRALFDQFAWLVGPAGPMPQIHYGLLATVIIAVVIALLAALPALVASDRADRVEEELRRTPQD